jgi:hypothetical protein
MEPAWEGRRRAARDRKLKGYAEELREAGYVVIEPVATK